MAYGRPEKLAHHDKSTYQRWLKRVRAKWFRLSWRRLGEAAPTRPSYHGWAI